ncbi:putative ABC transporter permease [Candidatus Saccharibacteria bacterium]|nr:putative ABC transporter permease [Candidatus Saccharibacteria bacterium]
MIENVIPWVLYFFVYAISGYVVETLLCSLREQKLVSRGFLFGPLLPVYGFGMSLILVATFPVRGNLSGTFFVAMFACSLLEYATSWAMEKLFGLKWWDYSRSDRWNLNGRICARNCLAFGIAGCLIVYQVHPRVESLVALLGAAQLPVAVVLLALLLLDFVASVYAVEKVKHSIKLKLLPGDQTNEVKKLAGRAIAQLFTGKNYLERRIAEIQRELEKRQAVRRQEFSRRRSEFRNKFEKHKS